MVRVEQSLTVNANTQHTVANTKVESKLICNSRYDHFEWNTMKLQFADLALNAFK